MNTQLRSFSRVNESCSVMTCFMTPWTVVCQIPLSIGFPRRDYWSGLPFPSPGDLPDTMIEPKSSALPADSLLSEHKGSPKEYPKYGQQTT